MLAGALGKEVVANMKAIGAIGASQEKTVPSLTDGSDDALVPPSAYVYLVNTLGQGHVQRKADGLGAVVDEKSTDGHAYLKMKEYTAIVYCTISHRQLLVGHSTQRHQ